MLKVGGLDPSMYGDVCSSMVSYSQSTKERRGSRAARAAGKQDMGTTLTATDWLARVGFGKRYHLMTAQAVEADRKAQEQRRPIRVAPRCGQMSSRAYLWPVRPVAEIDESERVRYCIKCFSASEDASR